MSKIIGVIPARYESTRFPGKPLAIILGKPMIQWVYERVSLSDHFDEVIVATDDERIYQLVTDFGGKVVITGECKSGTDRVYQAVKDKDYDIVVNIQGDEPAISIQMIEDLISAFSDESVEMATLKKRITCVDDMNSCNVVKVVCNRNSDALYFSRQLVPYGRDCSPDVFKHIGIYGYKKEFLKTFVEMGNSDLENTEKLEQLRVLDYGYKIRVVETQCESFGVDAPKDIERIEEVLSREEGNI